MSRKTVWVLTVVVGDGPLEDVRVYGPWRTEDRARAAEERLEAALLASVGGSYDNLLAEVVRFEPEFGPADRSLTSLCRQIRAATR